MVKTSSSAAPIDNRLSTTHDAFKNNLEAQIKEGYELITKIQQGVYEDKLYKEFREWSDFNFELLKQSFVTSNNDYMDSYNHTGYSMMGPLGEVPGNPAQSLINLIEYKLGNLNSLLKRTPLLKSTVSIAQTSEASKLEAVPQVRKPNNDEIFIVHGHDEAAKVSLARLLEKLKLKPIILHEQSSGGKTIIEKIETYSNVGFAVVLYTECDLGGKDQSSLKPRARQNVVFEHGYLMGKIGRPHVYALVKGNVETPGDISGVVYTPMDEHGAWQYNLAKELSKLGYAIEMGSI